MEANTPTPSRTARKHILLRAYSASGGLMPRSLLSERRPDTAEPRLFCESLAFTIFPELTLCALVPTVVFIYHS